MKQQSVDAWMFLAIAVHPGSGTGVRLADVIASADAINHAIPLDAEVRGGVNRLIHADLIAVDADELRVTEGGARLMDQVRGDAGTWARFQDLEKRLAHLQDPPVPSWDPPERTIQAAIDEYCAMAEEWLRRNP